MEESVDLPGFHYDPSRKRYFKINSQVDTPPQQYCHLSGGSCCSSSNEASLEKPVSQSVAKLVQLRECGQSDGSFHRKVMKCKLRGFDQIGKGTIHYALDIYEPLSVCTYLAMCTSSGANKLTMIGIWGMDRQQGTQMQCAASMAVDNNSPSKYGIHLLNMESLWSTHFFGRVMDVCCMRNGILVGMIKRYSHAIYLPQILASEDQNEPSSRVTLGSQAVFSCAFNEVTQRVAFGMENDGIGWMWPDEQPFKLFTEKQSIFCLTFMPRGDVVLSGTRKGNIFCSDLRISDRRSCQYKIELNASALCHLQLLQSENEVVCSGHGNCLLKVDLRSRRPLLKYTGHVNRYLKTPFSVSEELGVLCCTGQDCVTRLWDLHRGSLLVSRSFPGATSDDEIPRSLFTASWMGNKKNCPALFLAHKDQMYAYQMK